MTEIFKDITGFNGNYQVSNLGNVKSLNYHRTGKEMLLSPGVSTSGYLMVILCKDGKMESHNIHRLVAEAFLPNPNGYPCINHRNECKQDNSVDNLEWCSYKYNNTYNDRHLKTAKSIFCLELNKVFQSSCEAERQTGIYQSNINRCLKGIRKSAGGYHWRYL